MRTIGKLAVVFGVVVLAAGPTLGGLLDRLKAKAKEEAQKKAMEAARKKVEEMASKPKPAEPPKEPEDKFQGLYEGTYSPTDGQATGAEATVVGYVDRKTNAKHWDVVVKGKDGKVLANLKGTPDGEKVKLADGGWSGEIADGRLAARAAEGSAELRYTVRRSPTLGAKPPAGAIVLLPFEEGKPTSLAEWTNPKWVICTDGSVLVRGGNSFTKRTFRDFKVHIEFYCPYMPDRTGQGRANSGCYMHSKYEVQVLDSFGLAGRDNECGGIYTVAAPAVNAALPPGQWQTYDIVFTGPRIGADGSVEQFARFLEVLHNGVKIHQNVQVKKVTTGGKGSGHVETEAIMLQDHGNPVRYRNIWLVETGP